MMLLATLVILVDGIVLYALGLAAPTHILDCWGEN